MKPKYRSHDVQKRTGPRPKDPQWIGYRELSEHRYMSTIFSGVYRRKLIPHKGE